MNTYYSVGQYLAFISLKINFQNHSSCLHLLQYLPHSHSCHRRSYHCAPQIFTTVQVLLVDHIGCLQHVLLVTLQVGVDCLTSLVTHSVEEDLDSALVQQLVTHGEKSQVGVENVHSNDRSTQGGNS